MGISSAIILLTTFFICCANASFYTNDPKYCYSSDALRPQLKMFSTTTMYNAVRGSAFNPSKCKPIRFWFISRHGSRYPSVADQDSLFNTTDPIQANIMSNYNAGKTTLCERDAKNIKNWSLDPTMLRTDAPANLSASGRNELVNMAKRYQAAFPGLLPKFYSRQHYFFRHSPYLRTLQTAQAFAEGLFGATGYQQVNYTGGSSPDLFMFSFGSCPAWIELAYSHASEVEAFTNGPKFQELITQVSNKLGFYGSEVLSLSDIKKLMTHCQYEQILNPDKLSPFCAAFSILNNLVYEYYKDLQFYYLSGYGYRDYRALFKNMNCHLMKDLLNFLVATGNQKARLNFGHDVTVQFLLVALGVFEDAVPLTASNFEQQYGRQWKTSLLTPMGANLAVVRYE